MGVIGPDRLTIATDRKGEPLQLGGFIEYVDPWATKAGCVNVEYVRADLHRGAVERAESVAREMRAYAFTNARHGDSGWADDVIRWADALDGGRSPSGVQAASKEEE